MLNQDSCSSETTKLAKALIQVQRNLQPASKDSLNPFTNSNYASLNSVMDSCREALLTNGVWLTQYPVPAARISRPSHKACSCRIWPVAGLPCCCSITKKRSPGVWHRHDLYQTLFRFCNAWNRHRG